MAPRLLSALLTLVCSVSISAAPALLRNPRPLRVEGKPFVMLKGDFGGDAAEDLLFIANDPAPTTIQVLLNVPGGPFAAPVVTPIADSVGAAAAGDFDHDGKLDLVIARPFTTLVVYRGIGDGTFARGQTVETEHDYSTIVVADFNADGHSDVAVGNLYYGYLSVHFGDGTGALGPSIESTFYSTRELQPAHLNADNFTDLIAMGDTSARVLFGNGDGHFHSGPTLGVAMGVAVGDFNGDAKTDVMARSDSTDSFRVYLQADGETFTAGQTYRVPVNGRVRASDIDADAKLDVIVSDYVGTISVLRGHGDGTFQNPEHWFTDVVTSFETGDFNRDGAVDVVFRGAGVFFIAGTGGGAFDAYRSYAPLLGIAGKRSIASAAAADMNGDGKPDVVLVAAADGNPDIPYELVVLLGDGAGNWTSPFITQLYDSGAKVAVGDVNHDGRQDAVVAAGVYLGRGDGTFDAPIFFGTQAFQRPLLADIDGDTHVDLIIPQTQTASSDIYRGAGTGSFVHFSTVPLVVGGIGDFNGDGKPDLAGVNNGLQVAINNGTGAFAISTPDPGPVGSFGAVADFNGDGFPDILVQPNGGKRVFPGVGDGTFGSAVEIRTPEYYGSGAAADLDHDGAVDFVIGSRILLGDGAGRFRAIAELPSGWTTENAVADFDLDGKSDLVVVNTASATFALVRTNRGPDVTRAPGMSLVDNVTAPEYARRVKHTATVTDVDIPVTGSVLFAQDGVPLALNWLFTSSTDWTTSFATGAHTFNATYSGDTWHVPVTRTIEYDVPRAKTTIGAYPQASKCAAEVFVLISMYYNMDYPLPGATGDLHFREGVTPITARKVGSGYSLSGLGVGTHTIVAEYDGDTNYEPSSVTFQQVITPSIVATMQASSGVFAGESGNVASITYSVLTGGTTVTWSITNGTIDSGQGTSRILYTAGPGGDVQLRVTFTKSGAPCDVTITTTVPIIERQPGASMLFTLTPCRVVDTRGNGAVGSGEARTFTIGGFCKVAPRAKSVAINVTVVAPSGPGWLAFYPSDIAWPGTSTMNYRSGRTRANHAIVPLSADGRITVLNSGPPTDILVDVMGYFY